MVAMLLHHGCHRTQSVRGEITVFILPQVEEQIGSRRGVWDMGTYSTDKLEELL
jgi:hypothetical protein